MRLYRFATCRQFAAIGVMLSTLKRRGHRLNAVPLLRRLPLTHTVRHLILAKVVCHPGHVVRDAVRGGQTTVFARRLKRAGLHQRTVLHHRESRLFGPEKSDRNAGAAIIARKNMAKKISWIMGRTPAERLR